METQQEFTERRARARAQAANEAALDLLVKALFQKPAPLPPLETPMLPGWQFRKQAE